MWDDGLISLIYFFPMDESSADVNRFNIQLNSIQKSITKHCKSALTWREWNVIKKRFYSCKTLEEVAHDQNVTRYRIMQIEGRALRKLRRFQCVQLLKNEYLDEDGNVDAFGRPLPNWIWTTGMHVYEKLWEADNISFDAVNPLTPLPWNDSVQSLEVFEESLRNTKPTAILKQIGYDIRQPEEERQAIIKYAISVCGFSRIYNCLKNLTAIRTNRLASAYRKDLMYVIRNQKRLVSLSPCDENSTTITIDFTNEDDDNHPKGNGKDKQEHTYSCGSTASITGGVSLLFLLRF